MTQPDNSQPEPPIDPKRAQELSRQLAAQHAEEDDRFEEGVAKQFEVKKSEKKK